MNLQKAKELFGLSAPTGSYSQSVYLMFGGKKESKGSGELMISSLLEGIKSNITKGRKNG